MQMVEMSIVQMITIGGGILGAFVGVVKMLLWQVERRLDQRFAVTDERFDVVAKDSDRLRNVELSLERLRGEMPLHYVRREDYVRNQTVIEAKLDGLYLKLENVQLKGIRP
ncbi:hypothetical protein [Pseudomonas poae]|uniref:hypothetical protein n=1 Tax=Pseudomonas poae TaxID=200451 RepID=UPI0030CAF053